MIGLSLLPSNMTALEKILKGVIITSKHKTHRINNLFANHSRRDMMKFLQKICQEILRPSFLNAAGAVGAFIRFYLQISFKIGRNKWYLRVLKKSLSLVTVKNQNVSNYIVNVFKENSSVINLANVMIVAIINKIRKIMKKQ